MSLTIVLDSNIWLGEQMLRHSAGSALRFYLRTHGARVALPEVVRLEVALHLGRQLLQLCANMRDNYGRLLRIVGSLRELVLPPNEELLAVAERAFENARIDISPVPFSLESARASFDKCLRGTPPSGPKDQQFKDGVIWSDCLRLAQDGPVHLVTADKGFYIARTYTKGLAPNLLAEAQATKHGVSISHEIRAVLDQIRVDVPVDYAQLHIAFFPMIRDTVEQMLEQEEFTIGELAAGEHTLFATDDPSVAHLEFTLTYQCSDPDGRNGTLIARGEGTLSPSTASITALRNRGAEFHYEDADGKKVKRSLVMGAGTIVIGHRIVQHEIRVPLGPDECR